MFTKKQQTTDIIKKSSLKVQDAKKDVFARLKHLKTILGESSAIVCHFNLLNREIHKGFKPNSLKIRILHNFWGRHHVVSLSFKFLLKFSVHR